MALSSDELASIANGAIDWMVDDKGGPFQQSIQDKPLFDAFRKKKKTFASGKGNISIAVKGATGAGGTADGFKGYTHTDTVAFYNPANLLRANYAWREGHIGIAVSETELKMAGVSVTDNRTLSTHSKAERTRLVDLVQDKFADMAEQYAKSVDAWCHGDGSADALGWAGIGHLIAANPTTGTVGGLSRATYTWWRNVAYTAAHAGAGGPGAITSASTDGGVLITTLETIYRQLTRFGGKPDLFIAGSAFMDAMQKEVRANGNYSMNGFANGSTDVTFTGLKFRGMDVKYDPMLDTNSLSKRAYIIDTSAIGLWVMDGEFEKSHTPERPVDKFVFYRSLTGTGQICASRLNSSAVIDIS